MENGRIERQMEFIVDTLASLSVSDQKQNARLDKLIESHGTADRRLNRYERILKLMIKAGRRERPVRSKADERLTKALAELAGGAQGNRKIYCTYRQPAGRTNRYRPTAIKRHVSSAK